MFGKAGIDKEYKRLIEQLEGGERLPPEHDRPVSVTDNGFESFATAGVRAVFEGFEYFGTMMNREVADPWTIEETADTLVKDIVSDGPELGRTYRIFYNGVPMGKLQVTEGSNNNGFSDDVDWHRENRAARAILDLNNVRFVPYHDALSIVSSVEVLVGPFEHYELSRDHARMKASAALTGYLWEVMRAGDHFVPSFSHRVNGPYDLLKITSDHWKEGGIDPFLKWNGDR
ncbi:hypothetical protein [Devosia sp. A369]